MYSCKDIRFSKGIFLVYVIILTAGCRNMNLSKFPFDNNTLLQYSNNILFITLETTKDTVLHLTKTEIIQSMVTDSKMKYTDNDNILSKIPGVWKISLLDRNNRIITSKFIENPFVFSKETFSEQGKIEKKKVEIYTTQIPLRFPYLKQMHKLQIDTINLYGQSDNIYRQPLPVP